MRFVASSQGYPFATAGSLKVSGSASVILDSDIYVGALEVGGVAYGDGQYTAAALGFTGVGNVTVQGASGTWYLQASQNVGSHWDQLSHWYSQRGSGGVNPVGLSPLDFHEADSYVLRTQELTSGEALFDGAVVRLTGSNGKLYLKVNNTAVAKATRLMLNGGQIITASSGVEVLNLARIDVEALSSLTASSGRTIDLEVTTLQGSGDLQTANSGTVRMEVLDAVGFTGTIYHNSGSLVFEALPNGRPFAMSGQLAVAQGASLTLNGDVYVRGLSIDGQSVADGVHTAASLGFSGVGSITIQAGE